MAGPIDVIQQALSALASAGIGQRVAGRGVCARLPGRLARSARPVHTNRNGNQQRNGGKRMSIISSEIEAQKQRDPSYIDSGLQWAWGRGYKAGASRGITEEEIAAAMAETRKFITLPGAWLENIIRIAFDAARRKAMEG